ncbi:hypothetical protein SCLARK_001824 [Spiroplasma clarkii]|uniref:Lipoprotein n=1 Tax=Spiroplasma clarkii TaxID=2139 RepID=A0A1Y0L2Q0_9MOLU|nr:hypothetical protein [Spiroplasma clarkii]ARU92267.1 hypothetical protein SCLARK_001824 [Spiroplasma clarkii]ATX71580.1 hypothetical protein SCLAR_v1c12820 [Spiroplasma clarkii]
MNRFKKNSWLFLVIIIMCSLVMGCGAKPPQHSITNKIYELPDEVVLEIKNKTVDNIKSKLYDTFHSPSKMRSYTQLNRWDVLSSSKYDVKDLFTSAWEKVLEKTGFEKTNTVKVSLKFLGEEKKRECLNFENKKCTLLNTSVNDEKIVTIGEYDFGWYEYQISTLTSTVYKFKIDLKIPVLNFYNTPNLNLVKYIENHNSVNDYKIKHEVYSDLNRYTFPDYKNFLETEVGIGYIENDNSVLTKIEDYIAKKILKMRATSISPAFNQLTKKFDSMLEDEYNRYDPTPFKEKSTITTNFCKVVDSSAMISERHFCGQTEIIKKKLLENGDTGVFNLHIKIYFDHSWSKNLTDQENEYLDIYLGWFIFFSSGSVIVDF